jgi:hypothetical protein
MGKNHLETHLPIGVRREFKMFRHTLVLAAAIILLTPLPLWCGDEAVQGVPVMKEVVPATAAPGGTVTVTGEYLDRLHVAEVYLTKASVDTKVQVTAQSKAELRFKVPVDLEGGRYGITLLTAAKVPMLLDQPVWLLIKKEVDTAVK